VDCLDLGQGQDEEEWKSFFGRRRNFLEPRADDAPRRGTVLYFLLTPSVAHRCSERFNFPSFLRTSALLSFISYLFSTLFPSDFLIGNSLLVLLVLFPLPSFALTKQAQRYPTAQLKANKERRDIKSTSHTEYRYNVSSLLCV
jgi:hypothetical protein